MFVFALVLKREQAPINASALLKPENIIIVAMLISGLLHAGVPGDGSTIPFFDPLYWATRAAYSAHGLTAYLHSYQRVSEPVRERSFEFMMGSFAMTGNAQSSTWDLVRTRGGRSGLHNASSRFWSDSDDPVRKVVALFLFGSMAPLFELFWRTDFDDAGRRTYFVFFGLYLCASRETGSFLAGRLCWALH